jgi:hypothetical protein
MNQKDLRTQKGQSIILVAAAMVLLVMFVALAVDMSNAYYHRRTAQNGADGGALGGVRQMAVQINNKKKLDGLIQAEMNDFAERNGILDTDGIFSNTVNGNVVGYYVDAAGKRLPEEPKVGGGTIPVGAYGVECLTTMVAPTYFGGIVGLDGVTVHARAVSVLKEVCSNDCVVPIAMQVEALFKGNGQPKLTGCFNIWNGSGAGNFGWLNWTWQETACADESRTCPEDCKVQDCDSGCLSYNLDPAHCASGYIRTGDWAAGTSGVKTTDNNVLDWLDYYLGLVDGIQHPFTIPVYDYTNEIEPWSVNGGCSVMTDIEDPSSGGLHYHIVGFAKMQIMGYQLSQGGGQIMVGDQGLECETVGLDPGNGFRITARFLEWVTDWNTDDACYDPYSTLRASPKILE